MLLEEIKEKFINKKITLGCVESFTGGLFANTITSISGASKFFKGGIVTYATEEKIKLLGIDKEIVEKYGVISSEIAREMSSKGKKILDVDICVSFTGNAGPTAMENKPVGDVFISITDNKNTYTEELLLKGNRNDVKEQAINKMLEILSKKI